jgi:dTMP kinase
MPRGLFITFEGGEGTGKSTQVALLAQRIKDAGHDVIVTREPGGSPGAEAIRALLVAGDIDRWSPLTEALLVNAARRDHVERIIGPALAAGAVVISDRFADSTRAYQGVAGGVDAEVIEALEAAVLGPLRPDLTLILDLPMAAGLARAAARADGEGRFEAKGEAFHGKLAEAFLRIAAAEPDRCTVIDAGGAPDLVAARIWSRVGPRLEHG